MKLYISTLGEFDIKVDGQSVLKESNRMYKIYRLFEYFLTFRNKKLLPETIIDNLLSDSESDDPKNMLRTQIFRLRKIINLSVPENQVAGDFMSLNFTNGYYSLDIGADTVIDIDEFEDLIKKGDLESEHDINKAINFYQDAISIYKGLYLSSNAYEVWLVPTRNYYHRLYTKTLFKFIQLLKKNGENERIVSLCEEALLIEPYEENIHIELMDALLITGHNKAAMNHYEYAANMIEKELAAKPSARFVDFIDRIQNYSARNSDFNILTIEKDLDEDISDGAILCNLEHFKFLFNIQKRKSERDIENDYLCIVTINGRGDELYWPDGSKKIICDVSSVIERSLRKGDVFTCWNDTQILIMLHNVKDEGVEAIKKRLMRNLNKKNKKIEIEVVFQALFSENTVI